MFVSMRRVFAAFGAFMICFLSVAAVYATESHNTNGVVSTACEAGLRSVFVPALKNKGQSGYMYHETSGLMIIEAPDYRLMESAKKMALDPPNERERLPDSIHGSREAIWNTYLLPGGSIQHTLSLVYDGVFVTVVPKWTTAWSPKGFASSEKHRVAAMNDLGRVVTIAKSLNELQIRETGNWGGKIG